MTITDQRISRRSILKGAAGAGTIALVAGAPRTPTTARGHVAQRRTGSRRRPRPPRLDECPPRS